MKYKFTQHFYFKFNYKLQNPLIIINLQLIYIFLKNLKNKYLFTAYKLDDIINIYCIINKYEYFLFSKKLIEFSFNNY